ncbi:MAG: TonB-dependent receptor [Bacteroidales bacterium]|nr:TonB-dependent receptor [Bacteroidales bacterium]MCB9029090.1 TonB-dependent receptor [Bacteroidales bacterium]
MEQKLTRPIPLLKRGIQRHLLIAKLVLLTFTLGIFSSNAYCLGADDLNSDNTLQQLRVTGVVRDAEGQPMPGVAVQVEGTTTGTFTDVNGRYTLDVPGANASLAFSFVGYKHLSVQVNGRTVIDVMMEETTEALDEIVVVGYGTVRKSDVTGAVASVRADAIKNVSTTDAAAALQGKASGVQVLTNSGAPGQAATIRVRGYSSNSGNIGPLLIVDGLKVDNIQYLDPSMIESIEILKDAASAAIYGAQAGNGVVLITTKSGTQGVSSISYDFKYTGQSLARKPEIFRADDFIEYKRMSGLPIDNQLEANGYDGTDTDWFDVVFAPSWSPQHTFTFQGGNNQGHFFTSINYVNNDGMVKGDRDVYKRLTAQINADYDLKKWLQVGTNNSIENWSTKSVSQMSQYGSVMNSVMTLDPLTPVYYASPEEFAPSMKQAYDEGRIILKDPTNDLYYATSKYITDDSGNPLLQRDRVDRDNRGINLRGVIYGNLKPVKGLVVTSRFGYRVGLNNVHSYNTPYFATPQASSYNYNISTNANNNYYYQWENFANYNLALDNHNVTAMAGMSYTENNTDNVSASASGPNILSGYEPNFRYLNYVISNIVDGEEKTIKTFGNAPGKSTQISYFGRLIYTFANKYTVQGNFRADAFDSSKLSEKNRWGYFPSFSAGWIVSNENFFAGIADRIPVTFLKLRGSWGLNGNINVLNNYPYSTSIAYNSSWYQFMVDDGAPTYGSAPSGLANPDLTWETSEQLDLGIDMRFLNDRLSLSLGHFNKKTNDLLVTISPVPEIGVSSTVVNAGSVLNRGFEFEGAWKDKIGADFTYSVSANFATLHNEVTYLDPAISRLTGSTGGVDGTNNPIHSAFEVGYPIWYFRGYQFEGVDAATGAAILKDVNEDGQIGDADMTYIGKAIPDYTYGVNLNFGYKGLDLNLFGTGVGGNDIFTVFYRADTPMRNSLRYYYDNAWTEENTGGSMPDPAAVANDWHFWGSSASMFNGAYFKIKQLQLGYTLPASITNRVLINRLRCYVSLDDYFTFTKYPGADPETATASNNSASAAGYDNGTYPQAKKVIFGVNLTF